MSRYAGRDVSVLKEVPVGIEDPFHLTGVGPDSAEDGFTADFIGLDGQSESRIKSARLAQIHQSAYPRSLKTGQSASRFDKPKSDVETGDQIGGACERGASQVYLLPLNNAEFS